MTNEIKRKVLVALDGSDPAFETIRYLRLLEPFQAAEIVLFSVLLKVPEHYWDIEKQPIYEQSMRTIQAWQSTQEIALRRYMEEARQQLHKAGFPKNDVHVKIQERKTGIARDILAEARKGYAAVVMGRRGSSKLSGIVLGSVATKLLNHLDFLPLLIVGRCSETGKILIALDGSDSSMRTVDYVGETLSGSDYSITLVHVIRSDDQAFLRKAEERITPVFAMATSHLKSWGFSASQLDTHIITGAVSRAASIVEKAQQEGYCTIVVGRKGISKPRDFFIGRVSNKIVHLARQQVVWAAH
jgi:nucleotide-binding universal stress UspA family protein